MTGQLMKVWSKLDRLECLSLEFQQGYMKYNLVFRVISCPAHIYTNNDMHYPQNDMCLFC